MTTILFATILYQSRPAYEHPSVFDVLLNVHTEPLIFYYYCNFISKIYSSFEKQTQCQ